MEVSPSAAPGLAALLRSELSKAAAGHAPLADLDATGRAFQSALLGALSRAAFGPRAAARIELVHPPPGLSRIDSGACRGGDSAVTSAEGDSAGGAGRGAREVALGASVRVSVRVESFLLPGDGLWCVYVDGTQTACVGDESFALDVALPKSCQAKGAQVEIRAALLGGDLETPFPVRESSSAVLQFE